MPDETNPTPTADDVPIGPTRLGRYELREKLGEGGMGAVFLAFDGRLDREVAVKVLPAHVTSPDAIARFRREAKALAKLDHPNIIRAYDSDEAEGRHFLVMEYVPGTSLDRVLRADGPVSPTRAADYAHQAALALEHAHQQGLIHRDIKPSNLLLTSDGQVKLLDLGLARFLQDHVGGDQPLTREGVGMGTPDYAPAEQFIDARSADHRSDVYSLGCTLYHLISGRLPFPGTSLQEKITAHETKEPTTLEELCPDVPAGLAMAVGRMMAKRPEDRFQSAGEAAEALAPYVAGSSSSAIRMRDTATWDGSWLKTVTEQPRKRLPRRAWVGVGAVAAASVLAATVWLSGLYLPKEGEPEEAETTKFAAPSGPPADPAPEPPVAFPDDPDVLTVSQKPDGGGEYRTIAQALAEVKAGQTIRVLDGGTYPEAVTFSHADVTLESVGRATLAPRGTNVIVMVQNVPGVTVRGFRLRAESPDMFMAAAVGNAPGVTFEDLEIVPGTATPATGVTLEALTVPDGGRPAVVRGCRLGRCVRGIRVSGIANDLQSPQPCGDIILRDNRIESPKAGIVLSGELSRIQVVGNVITGAGISGIQLQSLLGETRDILIANNTVSESARSFCLLVEEGADVPGAGIRVQNNLCLSPGGTDFYFADENGRGIELRPGDGAAALRAEGWRFGHNWREGEPFDAEVEAEPGRIPPAKTDVLRPKIEVLSREPGNPGFLRPVADGPLANGGAGTEDPSLPVYVGALPPEGVEPWDWERTRLMPPEAKLLTVSKEPGGGGEYRTINDALKDAGPWDTVRVLDEGIYPESVWLDDRERFTGLTVEAPRRATLAFPEPTRAGVAVLNVPRVVVRGFRILVERKETFGAAVLGDAQGGRLQGLEVTGNSISTGLSIENAALPRGVDPLVIQGCTVKGCMSGIQVHGVKLNTGQATLTRGVVVRDNRVLGGVAGIWLEGWLQDVRVVGNLVTDCGDSGLMLGDLFRGSEDVLIANNTIRNPEHCLKIEGTHADIRDVSIRNNLFLASDGPDVISLSDDAEAVGRLSIGDNWRQVPSSVTDRNDPLWVPPGRSDVVRERIDLPTSGTQDPDVVRPAPDSPLATDGAGQDDPTLPRYVGALPPEGVEPWDWDRTWRARMAGRESRADNDPDAGERP